MLPLARFHTNCMNTGSKHVSLADLLQRWSIHSLRKRRTHLSYEKKKASSLTTVFEDYHEANYICLYFRH